MGLALEMRGIVKRFGELVANDGVDFSVSPGEVHALLGENGAGKTTLMRILYGLTVPDAGQIRLGGEAVDIRSPRQAIAAGIGMVTQHFSLVGPMTVAENLVLGDLGRFRLDRRAARKRVTAASQRFGLKVRPAALVEHLSVGEQQRVELLKALDRECRLLILDEPTAVLVPQEVEALFATIRRLRAEGLSVVFISHKLREVLSISDRITVLRQGRVVGTAPRADTDERELARLMVGRPSFGVEAGDVERAGDVVLQVEGLSAVSIERLPVLREVGFQVRAGEILGVAGVSGNGQTELAEALSGMRRPTSGSIQVGGVELAGAGPAQMVAAGMGRIAEDRHASLIGDLSVAYNLVLEHLEEFRRGPVLDEERIERHARDLIEGFGIRARPRQPVRTLSGGNMQKVVLARVLSRRPRVLVAPQPTRGLDVGATEYVRARLLEQRERGAAVVLISEDLDEILELADRVIVMYEGRVVGELDRRSADPDRLGLLMAGHDA